MLKTFPSDTTHENTELLELSMSPQRMLLPPSCVLMTSLSNGFLVSSFLSPERKESTLGARDFRFLSSLYRQPSSDSDPREKPFSKDYSCGHTTDFYLGKTDLSRANSSKICLGKFISGFALPR